MKFETIGLRAILEGGSKYLDDLRKIEAAEKGVGDGASKAAGESDKFGKILTKASLAATAGFVGLGAVAAKFAMDFEKQLDQVGAVAQASDTEMEQLRQTALQLGADTAFSAGEAAAAMEELAAGGRSVAQIVGGEAAASVALAAAGNYGLAESARTIATTMDVWKGTQLETNDVVNRLAGAANASRFGVEDMSAAIAQGGGVAAAVGVSFQDFSTGIAAVASSFASGSDAGTSFKTFMLSLDGTTAKAKKVIEEYGLSFRTATGELKPMGEIVQELHDKIGTLGEAQQVAALKTIFGNDAYRTAAGLMKMTKEEFDAMSKTMGETDAADVAAQRMGNLSGDVEALKGSLETLGISIGSKAIPVLRDLAQGATVVVNAFGEMPSSTQNLLLGFTALTVAMPAIIAGFQKVAAGIKGVQTAMTSAEASGAKFKLAMTGMALGLGAVAIAADVILKKSTGHGLIETLFGSPNQADRTAKAVQEIEIALRAAGEAADSIAVLSSEFGNLVDEFAAFEAAGGLQAAKLGPFTKDGEKAVLILAEMATQTRELAKAMMANGATTTELSAVYATLPPQLQAIFDKETQLNAVLAKQAQATTDAASMQAIYNDQLGLGIEPTQQLAEATTGLTTTATDVADFLANSWGPTLLRAFEGVSEEGQEQLAELALGFPPVNTSAEALSAYLSENFGPDVAEAFDKLVESTQEDFEEIRGAIESVLPETDETFAAWKARLEQMVIDQQNWQTNLTIIWDAMTAAGVAMPETILAAIAEKGPAFAAQFAKTFAEDPELALEGLKLVAPAVMGETADAITARIIGAEPGVTTAVEVGINKPLRDALAAGEADARAAAQLQHDAAIDAFLSNPGAATSAGNTIGGNFTDGVSSGIQANAQRIASAVTTMLNGLFGAAQLAIESGSPSKRAAREIGEPIAQGVAEGMTSTESLQYIDAATGLLTEAGMLALYGFIPDAQEAGAELGKAVADGLSGEDALAYIDAATGLLTEAGMIALYGFIPDAAEAGAAAGKAYADGFNTTAIIGPGGSIIPPGTVPVEPGATPPGGAPGANFDSDEAGIAALIKAGIDPDTPKPGDPMGRTWREWIMGNAGGAGSGIAPDWDIGNIGTPARNSKGVLVLPPLPPGMQWEFYDGQWRVTEAGTRMDFTDTNGVYTPGGGAWQSIPLYHEGTPYVPRTGLALLQRGERVVAAEDNMGGGWGGSTTNVFDFSGGNWTGTPKETEDMVRRVVRDVLVDQSTVGARRYGLTRR